MACRRCTQSASSTEVQCALTFSRFTPLPPHAVISLPLQRCAHCNVDIKTANCFLTADGHLKVGDLNVSKLVKHGLVKTQIGTPYYMSPEIWKNRPYDYKSDIWSIGCVLYELCALHPPFRAADIDGLSRAVQARCCAPTLLSGALLICVCVWRGYRRVSTPRFHLTTRVK